MVFSSFNFILIFLPLFTISYYLASPKYKNLCLLCFSIMFYTYGSLDTLHYVLILILSLLLNFYFGILIEKYVDKRKFFLVLSLILNVGMLFVFKYFDFFIDIINFFYSSLSLKKINLILPIGISFYTFQIMSYIFDVYYKKIPAEKNFINLSTYIIMFPQLIAGPIVRFADIKNELQSRRKVKINNLLPGLNIFIIGLASKVIIANQLSGVQVDASFIDTSNTSSATLWLVGFCYTMQLYFDFYGYSIMAIGLGKMIGINFMDNFNEPLKSLSVTEFWRRWHISLGTWFRDYMLYPILMSKTMKKIRHTLSNKNKKFANFFVNIIATFIVWFTTGLWHGASVNYIAWGLYFFVFMVIEQLFLQKFLEKYKLIGHIYLLLVVTVAFTIFSNENLSILTIKLQKMFFYNAICIDKSFFDILTTNMKSIILGIFFVIGLPQKLYQKISKNNFINAIIIISIFALSMYLIYKGYNDPFMYFRF